MAQPIRCVGLSLGLVDPRHTAREADPPDSALLKRLQPIIESRGGVMAEASGPLCALFRDVGGALECAVGIFENLESPDYHRAPDAERVGRIAVETGEVQLSGKQLHGTLCDKLSALIDYTPNLSIVVGGDAAMSLDPAWSSRTRPLQSEPPRGADAQVDELLSGAVEMPWRIDATTHQEATVLAEPSDVASGALFSSVELIVAGVSRRLQAADCPCTIGRDTRCNLVLSSGEASRMHATIEYEQNRFYYVDNSRNGSYVLTSAGEELFVHRERLWLVGRGAISAGAPLMNQSGELVRFVCEPYRSDETGGHAPPSPHGGPMPEAGTTLRRGP